MTQQKTPAAGSAREQAEALFKIPAKPATGESDEKVAAFANRDRLKAERLAREGHTPTKLRKFVETLSNGVAGRVAYVTVAAAMSPAAELATWKEDFTFNAAEAILAAPDLKAVYAAAIKDGCALVQPA